LGAILVALLAVPLSASATPVGKQNVTLNVVPEQSNQEYGDGNAVEFGISGNGPQPTGSVAFYICGPLPANGNCASGGTLFDGETLTTGFLASTGVNEPVGYYCFRSDYSGDSNYNPASDGGTTCFQVVPQPVTIDANSVAKTYGEPDPTPGYTLTAQDFRNGEDASTAGVTGSPDCTIAAHSKDAGSYPDSVSCSTGTLSAHNYSFSEGLSADLTIEQATMHIDASSASKTYGDSDPAATGAPRAADFVNGDTSDSNDITGASNCTVAPHSEDVGTYSGAITCDGTDLSSNNYTFVAGDAADFTINQAVVDVDANGAFKTYGDSDPAVSGVPRSSDFVNGDDVNSANITGSADCNIAPHSEDAGTYAAAVTCDPGTLVSHNYTFVPGDSADLTINQATIEIDASPASKTYGDSDPDATGVPNSNDFVNGDTANSNDISGTPECTIGSHSEEAGTYSGIISCDGTGLSSNNYTFVPGEGADFTIDQATMHVDANKSGKTYGDGDPDPTSTFDPNDFRNGDSAGSNDFSGSADCTIGSHSEDAGSYPGIITCDPGSLASNNYAFTVGSGADFTIEQATMEIDASPASKTYGDSDPAVTGVPDPNDFINGDTPDASDITGTANCTIGSHSENAGTYTGAITCDGTGLSSNNYAFTAGNSADFTINQATMHIDASPTSKTYGDSDSTPTGVARNADFVNGDTANSNDITGTANCTISPHSEDAGTYTSAITCDGTGLSSNNYTFVPGDSADLTINQATMQIDASSASKPYGDSDPVATGVPRAGDFVNGDTAGSNDITGSPNCTIGSHAEDAGTYTGAITCGGTGLSSNNYTFVTGDAADLTINQATVHVDAEPASKTYGDPDPTPTFALRTNDFQNGDTAATSGITGSPSCTIGSHSEDAGTYTGAVSCDPTGLSSNNYAFTAGNNADFTINQATVHVDADPASKTYGDSDPTPGYTLRAADFQNSDNASNSGITGAPSCTIAAHSENAGPVTGVITCNSGTLSSTDYAFAQGDGSDLTINQATVHVDANGVVKNFGDGDPTPAASLRAADFQNGDSASTSGITGAASCTIAAHSEAVSTYPGIVTCDPHTLAANNYTFTAGNAGDLTIGQIGSHTSSAVENATDNTAWGASEPLGGAALDAGSVSPDSGSTPTGTVTYNLFAGGGCSGNRISSELVQLGKDGSTPASSASAGLAAGEYSYDVEYSGDGNYAGSSAQCDPFTVAKAHAPLSVVVDDAQTSAPWTNTEAPGAKEYLTSTVGGVSGFTPTGTVTYQLFSGAGCTGSPASSDPVSVAGDGSVPATASAPASGHESARASYGGDSNYSATTSTCVSFSVAGVPSAPSVSISSPASGLTLERYQPVPLTFACADAAGPGIASCVDATGSSSGGQLDTAQLGSHVVTVTATSKDGRSGQTSIRYRVLPTFYALRISKLKTHADGTISFLLRVPRAGAVDVLETAWLDNLAHAAQLNPAPARFVFARRHLAISKGGTVKLVLAPNARGHSLVAHHRHPVSRIRLWLSFGPSGGAVCNVGLYGIQLGAGTASVKLRSRPSRCYGPTAVR
jgi:hypothetical protein